MILSRIPFSTPLPAHRFFQLGIFHAVAGALSCALQIAVYVCIILYETVYGARGNLVIPLFSLGIVAGLSYSCTSFFFLKTGRTLSHTPYTHLPRETARLLQYLCLANTATSVLLLLFNAFIIIPVSQTGISHNVAAAVMLLHGAMGLIGLLGLGLNVYAVRHVPLPPAKVVLSYGPAPVESSGGWENKGFAGQERSGSLGSYYSQASVGVYEPQPGFTTF